jgi:hypothetical protein
VPRGGPDPAAPSPAGPRTQTRRPAEDKPRLDIYGLRDARHGLSVKQNDPNWFDVVRRPSCPRSRTSTAKTGTSTPASVRAASGVKGYHPHQAGEIKTIFEFELFGTGVDAGQTTFRLRHAWGELGQVGAGQTWSPFMDIDVFPNSVEYWAPPAWSSSATVQLRWTPVVEWRLALRDRLERPGASADQGRLRGPHRAAGRQGRFPLPALSAHYRRAGGWGHVQVAGIVRQMKWDDLNTDQFDLSGDATRLGLNLSSNVKIAKNTSHGVRRLRRGHPELHERRARGRGHRATSNPRTPIVGKALPLLASSAFLDLNWNAKWTSTVGYSMIDIDNSRRPVRRRVQEGPVRAGQPALLPRPRASSSARDPVGQARELPRRLHLGRLPHPVLREIQLQALARRQVMNVSKTVAGRKGAPRRGAAGLGTGRALGVGQTPAEIQAALDGALAKYKT